TLVVEDLDAAREFYGRAFGLPEHYFSGDSAVFAFGDVLINLLRSDKGPELLDPVPVALPESGVRVQLTVPVEDVDAVAAGLVARGVELLRGPEDRPWGPRTASFRDPGGHVWEIAQR
ncbi:MAG TPA: VOC family protein, partial [Candidatus Limnocylindrales bacterium]|nr:VOC family protein [Candidatus Limnocylindrales bacterium]